jgi:nicotinamidase-related amidase
MNHSKTPARDPLLDPEDAVFLFIDHQSGLFQTVKDRSVSELRANVAALAKTASLMDIPVITTASVPEGPNGPHMPEIKQLAPHALYVTRKGEINAWDNEDFVKAVRATGRKTLIIAGVWTCVCVAFPALSALADGYKVYAVIDASGDSSYIAMETTMARLAQGGVIPINTTAVIAELQKTWNREDAMEFGKIYAEVVPNYMAAIESFQKAQEAAPAAKKEEELVGSRR